MIGRPVWRFDSVSSTQIIAFDLAAHGAPHGTVVRAEFQTHGRGRENRPWIAPAGSTLMFSVIIRPEQPLWDLGSLSLVIGNTLAKVFSQVTGSAAAVKWPNDVLFGDRKVSGILLQTRTSPSPTAVVGIGININTPPEQLPDGAASLASVSGCELDRELVFEAVLAELNKAMSAWSPQLTLSMVRDIEQRLKYLGDDISLIAGDDEITGRILGIAPNGGLRLRIDGEEQTVVSGEIQRGPRPIEARKTAG